jgi:hypothetical protein
VRGQRLAEIAAGIRQTIWGEFKGYESESVTAPFVVVIALDSTWFEVHSNNAEMLASVRSKFVNTDPPIWSKAWKP